ncbi:hypothetical protein H7K06_06835 [Priestia aryabhattai]|uniref:hypothetical protein n=1 Tax=Priestia aryabhattai TaxID=412384 RepID=UPI001C8DB929|nr:hypothetical protein [Priestia aryabhattai]MBX9967232.1 hypothetical protein [Priestia aryabhattai]
MFGFLKRKKQEEDSNQVKEVVTKDEQLVETQQKNGFNDYKCGFIHGIIVGKPIILRELVSNTMYGHKRTNQE